MIFTFKSCNLKASGDPPLFRFSSYNPQVISQQKLGLFAPAYQKVEILIISLLPASNDMIILETETDIFITLITLYYNFINVFHFSKFIDYYRITSLFFYSQTLLATLSLLFPTPTCACS